MKVVSSTGEKEFTFSHEFNAPKKTVFNAFSDIKALGEWWGPVESKNTALSLKFKKGGHYHYKMERDGKANYGKFTFVEIKPFDLIEYINSFADERGNIIPAPFDIPLPMQIFYRLVFTEKNNKTTITLTGKAIHATREEEEALAGIHSSMQQGFGDMFNQLATYLITIQHDEG